VARCAAAGGGQAGLALPLLKQRGAPGQDSSTEVVIGLCLALGQVQAQMAMQHVLADGVGGDAASLAGVAVGSVSPRTGRALVALLRETASQRLFNCRLGSLDDGAACTLLSMTALADAGVLKGHSIRMIALSDADYSVEGCVFPSSGGGGCCVCCNGVFLCLVRLQ
jgi:hypothetical protein